jgi:NADPH:quinone reductase-like Zn-dependent oxidoreductase
MATRATLTGSTLRSRSREEKATVIERASETLAPLWASAELTVPVSRSFALNDVAQAYDYFAQPGKFGKVILVVE